MNWGREMSPRPCTPRNERNFPRIRSLLHMAPTSQNDQPQRIERKLRAQTVRTDGQSLSREPRSREPQWQVRLDSPPQLRLKRIESADHAAARSTLITQVSRSLVLINALGTTGIL